MLEGVRGRVPMRMELVTRFDYASIMPWVRRRGDALTAVAGPGALCLRAAVETRGRDFTTVSDFINTACNLSRTGAPGTRRCAPGC